MNTGQMLITIGAIFLLSTVILTVNRGFLTTKSTMFDSRYGIIAVSLATSTMEAATQKAFDEQSDTLGLTSTNNLTQPNYLGLDAGESIDSIGSFDDFDDFNCFKDSVKVDKIPIEGSTPPKEMIFNTKCQVDYVLANNPGTVSANRTWHKRIIIKVYSPDVGDTIKMSSVFSYFYFR